MRACKNHVGLSMCDGVGPLLRREAGCILVIKVSVAIVTITELLELFLQVVLMYT